MVTKAIDHSVFDVAHAVKIDFNKKWLSKQKTNKKFNIDALGFKKPEMKILPSRK